MGVGLQRTITVLLIVYLYDSAADTFRPLPDMPRDLPLQIYNAQQALHLIETGAMHLHSATLQALMLFPAQGFESLMECTAATQYTQQRECPRC